MGRNARKAKAKKAHAGDESSSEASSSSRSSSAHSSSSSDNSQQKKKGAVSNNNKPGAKKGNKGTKGGAASSGGGAPPATASKAQQQQSASGTSTQDQPEGNSQKPTKQKPVQALYCAISGWPADMCEYNGNFQKCKQWHLDHIEEYGHAALGLAASVGADDQSDDDQQGDADGGEEKGRKQKNPNDMSAKFRDMKKEVTIDVRKRTGRKKLTVVRGLDLFGSPLPTIAASFKKKFSCGVAVQPGPTSGELGTLEMQGDNMRELLKRLPVEFGVATDAIKLLKDGKPFAGFPKDGEGKDEDSSDDE